jgi:hypothetical protein
VTTLGRFPFLLDRFQFALSRIDSGEIRRIHDANRELLKGRERDSVIGLRCSICSICSCTKPCPGTPRSG